MKIKNMIFVLLTFTLITSCKAQRRVIDIRSPCVSNDDGPCGPKRSINDWWLKDQKNNG